MAELRAAVGLRNLATTPGVAKKDKGKAGLPSFKQYREADGSFYFKLVDAQGKLLLQSAAFASPKEAGQFIATLRHSASASALDGKAAPADGVALAEVEAALQALAESGN
jgi:tryptophanyl-tRNA synthetase